MDEEGKDLSAAKTTAAEFIRDGLFRLGPTFVKLGQVSQTTALARPPPALYPPFGHPSATRRPPILHRYARRLTRCAVRVPPCGTASLPPCLPMQVVSTREDLLEKEYIDVLKDLQDNVPGFGGE